ncbi:MULTISPECIES: AfsR/SARP family transcriptional regulator [Micromonospora]|uniref:Transcriptional regulator n=1 Tax=Micromonospora solifontis TaxID=2487138 RepID=A0ABX9WGW5_9ACTN|nr:MULTISPECIES: AfsR/SARP family transcriptional regulator [Micromonospora]NES14649.1 tetratricopeptide repeat protein [Micromonospora sp. PPF5-17B]NES36631.1 tetratricopeptide repeat protein [Micromonospora solifontis]NES55657.1 tetratricopeptide repeat protein [Micromonospora sp. PPF5-6]RNL99227.1 transcriptional regulator [Micromonospora solifontis]
MRFRILGSLRVGGGEATVTAGRDRTVLAMLLLRAGRVVPVEELIDAVWEERPPATARTQLQICVSRLRQRLAVLGLPPEIIVRDPVGYGIRIEPDDLDSEVFVREVDTGRAAVAAGQPAEARRHYRAALALWRGAALSGITSRSVRRRAQALDERRLAALEECVDVELRLGQAADIIVELTEGVERNPLRERLRGQLMLALSSVGRQADALAVYREGRRIYAEELGIEPVAALQELHQRILAGDTAATDPERSPPVVPVRSLPRAISDFTGRQQTVARLVKEIEEDATRVHVIDGMAGSGKTTLAVHVATALADRFPDAQLFIDLHGHSEREPLTPAAAVATLLRQLGVPAERIPLDLDDRLVVWRTELATRRALVVLDNAADAAQVMPLLPSGADNLVLITSRRRLVGLDDGRPSSLPVLDSDEAIELLGRIAGPDRVAVEPEAAAEVVRRCGHLPLAIRLAGARLAHRPRWRIADLAERLATGRDPLAELAAGERSVGQAFALSYAQVSAPARRLFRLLGLHPGARFDNRVGAALAEVSLPETQDLLDELVDANLVEESEPGRYRLHDLLREYARRLADEPGRAGERRSAVERLLDHHLYVAATIARIIEPVSSSQSLFRLPVPPRPDLVAATEPEGRAWFDENRAALAALVRLAEAEGFLRHCWQLARATWWSNFDGGHLGELSETHAIALRAAEALGDDMAATVTMNYLASAHYRLGRFAEASRLMGTVVDRYRRLGLRRETLLTLCNLTAVHIGDDEYRHAEESVHTSLRLGRYPDDTPVLSNLFNNLAIVLIALGRYEEALRAARRHLALAREHRDLRHVANAIGHLGMIRHRMGHREPARRLLRVALQQKRSSGNRFGEGEVLNEIAAMEREDGRLEHAAALHRAALSAMTDAGDRIGQCASRNLLARALLDQGDVPSALDLHRRVLQDATRLGLRYEQARALEGMARCLQGSDPRQARAYASRALTLFRQVESPDQRATEELLAALG